MRYALAGPLLLSAQRASGGPAAGGGGGARLTFSPIDLHLRHAWTLSRNSSTAKRNWAVRITCDGLTGLGEAAPNVRFHETPESVARDLTAAQPIVAAGHPSRRVALLRRLAEALPQARAARCAIDMALWDWHGRALGAPLWRLLGLDADAAPLTSFSIAIADKALLAQKVREAAPYPLLKVKLGSKGPITDREIVETVHQAAPGKRLRVDPNEGWDLQQATQHLAWLAGLRLADGQRLIELCEQPLPAANLPALRSLHQSRDSRARSDLPVLLDESVLSAADLPSLAGACDGVVIKLQKGGGVTGALEQIVVARALGLKVMLGCMIESSLGITAAAHLAPLCDYVDLDGHLLVDNDPYTGVEVTSGRLRLPQGPGLGVAARRAAAPP